MGFYTRKRIKLLEEVVSFELSDFESVLLLFLLVVDEGNDVENCNMYLL